MEHESQASEPLAAPKFRRGAHPTSLANLRPAFAPGQSGNPSGLTKDGRSPARVKLERALHDEIDKSGGMHALAKRWVAQAKKGNPVALAKIIDRLYPLEQQQGGAQVVHVGVRLEPTPGSASVSIAVSSSQESHGGPVAQTVNELGPRDVEVEESSLTGTRELGSYEPNEEETFPPVSPQGGAGSADRDL